MRWEAGGRGSWQTPAGSGVATATGGAEGVEPGAVAELLTSPCEIHASLGEEQSLKKCRKAGSLLGGTAAGRATMEEELQ